MNGKHRIACEVAVINTIKYELQNIQKCSNSGFDKVAVIPPVEKNLRKIQNCADAEFTLQQISKVYFIAPENFHLFLDSVGPAGQDENGQEKAKGYDVTAVIKQSAESDITEKKRTILDILSNAMKRKSKTKND